MNISSLVVKVSPGSMDSVLAALSSSDLCDVHFHDQQKGTIVVTIEGRDVGEEMDKLKEIENMPHVLGAALVYSYSEAELSAAAARIAEGSGDPVPEDLRDS